MTAAIQRQKGADAGKNRLEERGCKREHRINLPRLIRYATQKEQKIKKPSKRGACRAAN